MKQKRTYSILTTASNRIEVKAYNVEDAYRQARKQLQKHLSNTEAIQKGWVNKNTDLTPQYMTFGRDGINFSGFKSTEASREAYNKFKL